MLLLVTDRRPGSGLTGHHLAQHRGSGLENDLGGMGRVPGGAVWHAAGNGSALHVGPHLSLLV